MARALSDQSVCRDNAGHRVRASLRFYGKEIAIGDLRHTIAEKQKLPKAIRTHSRSLPAPGPPFPFRSTGLMSSEVVRYGWSGPQ